MNHHTSIFVLAFSRSNELKELTCNQGTRQIFQNLDWASGFVSAELPVRSYRKLFIFII